MPRRHGRRTVSDSPATETQKVIGVVWAMPSHETARTALLEVRQAASQLRPGPQIDSATLFSAFDREGYCVVLVGIGLMFDAAFLARCGVCIQKHQGIRLSESGRTREMIAWAHKEWLKVLKEEKRKVRMLMHSERRRHV